MEDETATITYPVRQQRISNSNGSARRVSYAVPSVGLLWDSTLSVVIPIERSKRR